jgi:hypothetical protein
MFQMKLSFYSVLALLLAIAIVLVGFSPVTAQEDDNDPEIKEFPAGVTLPDLRTLPVTDLRLEVDATSGERVLRFSNSIANTGDGALELRGVMDEEINAIVVSQHILGLDDVLVEPLEGTFYFSGEHLHWHWEEFAAYEIWTVETGGELSRVVLPVDKLGFCLYDDRRVPSEWIEENIEGELEIAPQGVYRNCRFGRQGISAGWVDVYEFTLPGQAIDVTDLEDGVYALRSVADPEGILYELDSENNDTVLYFALHEDELMVLGEEFSLMDYFAQLVDAGHIEIIDGKVVQESAGDGSTSEE